MRFTIPLIILLAILPTAHQSAAQGTPQATEPVVCSDLESLIATPVTSPTIPQSTSGFNRANVVLAAENLVACRNAEEWTILAGLMQPAYRLEQFGSEQIEGIAENMSSLAESGFLRPLDLVAMGEPSISSQFGTVAVTTQEGYVLRREEWQFRQTDDRWLFSEVFPLPPLLATNGVGIPVSLTGSGLETTRTSLVNPGAVILGLTNSTGQPVSFAVFRALGTQSPGDFLAVLRASGADPAFVVGWVVVPSESTSELVLSGLPDGVYTIVAGYDPRSPGTSFDTADVVQISIVS